MARQTLKAKLMKSGVAAAKAAPVVGPIVGLFDDLNNIWRGSDREFDDLLRREADLMVNITKMVDREGTEIISKIESRFPELQGRILELAEVRMLRPRGNITTISQLLGEIVSGAIRGSSATPEVEFASRNIDDLELAILVHVHSRQGRWQSISVEDKRLLGLDQVHDRELALSLSQLEQLGFLERGRPETSQHWREREFTPDLKEIDDFCATLRVLPIIAMMPDLRYAGAAQMAEQGTLVAWVRELSQDRLRTMAWMFSAVRRHPFEGYQWTVSSDPTLSTRSWTGQHWQHADAQDAIRAADSVLLRDGQTPDWIYIAA
jgi:hypothetical protein